MHHDHNIAPADSAAIVEVSQMATDDQCRALGEQTRRMYARIRHLLETVTSVGRAPQLSPLCNVRSALSIFSTLTGEGVWRIHDGQPGQRFTKRVAEPSHYYAHHGADMPPRTRPRKHEATPAH